MREPRIQANQLSKQYFLPARRERYQTLRDQLTRLPQAVAQRTRQWLRQARQPKVERGSQAQEFWALRNVSFEVQAGEVVGIIGRNGAGKTTLLKILSRITEPTSGTADIRGRIGSLLEVGTGFHPELSGRENIFLSGAILGMRRRDILKKFDEIVAFAEIERFVDTPVKHYSSGLYMRLAFSVAAHLEPETLLVDEVLAVGDALFQQKCLGKMGEVTQAGRTVLFVSHNMAAVRSLCNKGLLLEQGELVEFGDINRIIERYYLATGLAQQTTSAQSAEAAAGRPGFGPVRLGTGAGNTLEHSGPLAVKTSLYLERPSSGVSLFCILEDAQGNNIFHLREESSTYGWETNASGRYEIELTLPALWLNPGLYSLYFKVLLWQEYGSARYLSDRLLLDVTGKSSAVNALLHPQATWEFNHVATPLAEPACR